MMFEAKRRIAPKPNANAARTKDRAKALKQAGLIDYDLRKPLTETQRRRVNRIANKIEPALKNRSKFFELEAPNKSVADKARHSGFLVYGKKIFAPKEHYTKAKIIDDSLIMTRPDSIVTDSKGRKKRVQKREEILLRKRENILDELERLKDKPLPERHYLMVKIGDNRAFPGGVRKRLDYSTLFNYVSNWEPDALKSYRAGTYKGGKSYEELMQQKAELISQMSIVSYRIG